MRVLAVDPGARRVGLAISDPTGTIAQPLETVDARKALERIEALVRDLGVERIVVGLPLHMSGGEGEEARRARSFARAVAERTGVPTELLDERWTSLAADRSLREAGMRGRRRKGARDRVAAALLLETYLARRRSGAAP